MKLSTTYTGRLLVKAKTGSEWDNVDFTILDLSEKRLAWLAGLMRQAAVMEKDPDLTGFMYFTISNDESWYVWPDDTEEDWHTDEVESFFNDDENQAHWVEITDEELNSLPRPEQQIRYGMIKVYDNSIQQVSYGKQTDEEFFTEGFNPQDYLTIPHTL
jgi:hypothetical protein